MEAVATKEKINAVADEIRSTSYESRTEVLTEAQLDGVFDAVNDVRQKLVTITIKLSGITTSLEALTWFSDLDEDDLMHINEIIVLGRHAYSAQNRQYAVVNKAFNASGFAKQERKDFKSALEDFIGAISDLELVFFDIPNDEDFKRLSSDLQKL